MAIANMDQFNLILFKEDTDRVLKILQDFEYVHFNNLKENDTFKELELESTDAPKELEDIKEEISRIKWMLELLEPYRVKQKGLEAIKQGKKTMSFEQLKSVGQKIDYISPYNKLKRYSDELEDLESRVLHLKYDIHDMRPWEALDMDFSKLKPTHKLNIVAGYLPDKYMMQFRQDLAQLEYTSLQKVSNYDRHTYVLLLTLDIERDKLGEVLRKNAFNSVKLPRRGKPADVIKKYRQSIKSLEDDINTLHQKIANEADLVDKLQIRYEYANNIRVRLEANKSFLKTNRTNLIQGYIPHEKREDFVKLLDKILKNDYHLDLKDADRDDPNVPIILENNKFVSGFESVTAMYALPKYNEIDPTPIFAPFYWMFFGMMVGDFGYGLLLFFGTLIALKAFNLDKDKKDMIRFLNYCSISTIIWGLIYGSFLGGIVEMPGLIDIASDYMTVLVISMLFGGIQLFVGLGVKGYMEIRDGKPLDAVYDVLFWYMAVMGAIVTLGGSKLGLEPIAIKIGKYAMIIGMVGIILTGGRDAKSIVGKFGGGLYELYGISGWLGDFVSYIRLMALGLSGTFIAVAINMIVKTLWGGIGGMIGGAIIFAIGQMFNMFLSYLSSYVHAARLIYVEFFGKFYEGGGKPFNKFRSKSKYLNIEK
ncbi:MAG: V-type ATP synthase subunit I [Tissierellia bacterium]|nr:V-type ATP synthase subunit I [Tissierellia bacterium]